MLKLPFKTPLLSFLTLFHFGAVYMLEVVTAGEFNLPKSTGLHCMLQMPAGKKVVCEEDTKSGTDPSKWLIPLVKSEHLVWL